MDSRSFSVDKGRLFSIVTPDGPFVAHEGDTVLIIRARSYEEAQSEVLKAFKERKR